jgi:hypothetical protein
MDGSCEDRYHTILEPVHPALGEEPGYRFDVRRRARTISRIQSVRPGFELFAAPAGAPIG